MIRVEIRKNSITVKGHAESSAYGTDIVCASVSKAVIMSVNQILLFGKAQCIEKKVFEGDAQITVVKEDEIVKKVIDNLVFTLKDLELQYPKYIKINVKL